MIIAIEGIDGAGKNTLVTAIREQVDAEVLAFPRYDTSIHAQLAQAALHWQMGDLTESAYAMATLFALDRAGAAEHIRQFEGSDRVLLLDRYTASNAAYSWARTRDEGVVEWVRALEFDRLSLPTPDLQVLLDTPPEVAGARAIARAEHDQSRARDVYERDAGLQQRTWEAYVALADKGWVSEWMVTSSSEDIIRTIS